MNMFKRLNISGILLFVLVSLNGQPSYIYEGGNGASYSSAQTSAVNAYFYFGAFGEGYSSIQSGPTSAYFYSGAFGEGYSSIQSGSGNAYIYSGAFGEGYSSDQTSNVSPYFYEGGTLSGYVSSKVNYQGVTFYEGNIGQGYDLALKCEDFIWTGTIGTGWGVSGNWNYNVVPNGSRPVIIPAGVPNFPSLNAGILAIGDNPNGGAFECKSMWIQEDAMVETKINNFVENYGEIIIDGNMRVKNSASNAFMNFGNGIIQITATGSLVIKP